MIRFWIATRNVGRATPRLAFRSQLACRRRRAPYRTRMWIVAMTFTEGPERLAARAAHRQRLCALHREGIVRMAGPFTDGTGALIVLDVPDRGTLDALMAADPFFTTPGVLVAEIRQWQPYLR